MHEGCRDGHLDETLPGLFSTIALWTGSNQDEGTVFPVPQTVQQTKNRGRLHPISN